MSVAGAYWHGDETKQQLQRVYGIAFPTQKELDTYLNQIEEAKKRDHRVIGKQMGLFTISPLVGSGLILWMPKGAIIRQELEQFMREELAKREYVPVYTPHIGKVDLYKISGHYPYYQESQFPTIKMKERDKDDDSEYLLKPMNCPHHIQIYAAEPRSYRDLPVRLAEFGTVYRFEQSGELNGMTRVRGFTQDDAHLFCTPEQVEAEFRSTVEMVMHVFETLGFKDYECRVSLRDPGQRQIRRRPGELGPGRRHAAQGRQGGRHQGRGSQGRSRLLRPQDRLHGQGRHRPQVAARHRAARLQPARALPARIHRRRQCPPPPGDDPPRPVRLDGTLHRHSHRTFRRQRSPPGSRPTQVAVLTISEKFNDYAKSVLAKLKAAGVRTEIDLGGDKIGGKIRRAREAKIPYMLILGAKEAEQNAVAVRTRKDKDLGAMPVDAFLEKVTTEIRTRACRANKLQTPAACYNCK